MLKQPLKTVLPNGMTVVLQESHAAPVVSINLCCKVGSRYEKPREAGICHLIEHMIFKGTPTYPVGEIAKQVEASGGDINAYTSFDETVFYINMASHFMDEGLNILADAALNPLFDKEELTREKEVVVEEIARYEDSPGHQVSEDLFRHAFRKHPYGNPIAGSRESVRAISRKQLFDFYRKWYVGPNLIFVMVGDFDANEVLAKVKKLYRPLSSKKPPRVVMPQEPKQTQTRAHVSTMNVKGSYLGLAFHSPALTSPDVPALDVLSHILTGGDSSRLDQGLKESTGLVRNIDSACYTPQEPCLFFIDAELSHGNPKQVIKGIFKELNELHSDLVSPTELIRAKTNLRSAQVYERETVEGLARKLGFFEIVAGDYNYESKYYEALEEVTPEKIQEVVRRYLRPENMTIALCASENKKHPSATELIKAVPAIKKPTKIKRTQHSGDTHLFKLNNGVRLIVRSNPQVPVVAMRAATLGGLRFENEKNNGLCHLVAESLVKGTEKRSSLDISNTIESMAGTISGYAGRNLFGLRSTFLSEKLDDGLDLFCDSLLNPSFDAKEIQKEKRHILTAIRDQNDHPARLAMKRFLETLFPNHPYRMAILGTGPSVRALKPELLARSYKRWLQPKNLVVSVVGDVQAEHIRELLTEPLEGIKANTKSLPKPAAQKAPQQSSEQIIRVKGKSQAHIVMGFLGTTLKNQDRFGLDVLNAVLSGQGGRLFLELRDKQSLCYTVNMGLYEGMEPGFISIYMGTDPSKLETALSGIRSELEKLIKKAPSIDEIARAKRFLIGNYALELQRNSAVGALLAYDEVYGLGYNDYLDYAQNIQKITRQDVQRLAKKYLRLDRCVTVIAKP